MTLGMTRLNQGAKALMVAIYFFFASGVFTSPAPAAEISPSGSPSAASKENAKRTATRPFLWKVEGARPSWLFGTIHSSDPGVAHLPANVWATLDASQSFHPEVEITSEAGMALAGKLLMINAPDLSTRISPALWVRTQKAAAAMGLPDMVLQRLPPGLAAMLFAMPPDVDPFATVDGQLQARAVAKKIKVTALETMDEQLDALIGLPEKASVTMLSDALDELDHGRPNEQKLYRAYATGDERTLLDAIEAEYVKSPASRALTEPLIYRRNRVMADRLAPHIAAGGAFVAIGTAHLIGPKSVIELLRARGLKVTRVP